MDIIPPETIKALRWEASDGTAGVGIYQMDDGCPRAALMQVEMTVPEMMELAHDLLTTARDLDPGAAYLASVTRPSNLTPEDESVIRGLLADNAALRHRVDIAEECCCSIDWDHRCPVHGPQEDDDDDEKEHPHGT